LVHIRQLIADEEAAEKHRSQQSAQVSGDTSENSPTPTSPSSQQSNTGLSQVGGSAESLHEKALRFAKLAEKVNIRLHEKYSRRQRLGVGYGSGSSSRSRHCNTQDMPGMDVRVCV
jgi:hypothetical protein